jgi:hypothetical protein
MLVLAGRQLLCSGSCQRGVRGSEHVLLQVTAEQLASRLYIGLKEQMASLPPLFLRYAPLFAPPWSCTLHWRSRSVQKTLLVVLATCQELRPPCSTWHSVNPGESKHRGRRWHVPAGGAERPPMEASPQAAGLAGSMCCHFRQWAWTHASGYRSSGW